MFRLTTAARRVNISLLLKRPSFYEAYSGDHSYSRSLSDVQFYSSSATEPKKGTQEHVILKPKWMPMFFYHRLIPLDLHEMTIKRMEETHQKAIEKKDTKILEISNELTSVNINLLRAEEKIILYKLLLGIRTRIKSIEDYLWPAAVNRKHFSRTDVWTNLLKSQDPEFINSNVVMEFRKRLAAKKNFTRFWLRLLRLQ